MTSSCIGKLGTYQFMHNHCDVPALAEPTVWVAKRYIPTDLRATAPVARYKTCGESDRRRLPAPGLHWVPEGDPQLRTNCRDGEQHRLYISQPATRCEQYSTMRQILPSQGRAFRHHPANWGTGFGRPPVMVGSVQQRFPHINSPMTRYVDSMHLSNRLFQLY